ncbi:hypothetical protein D9758_012198 [Tetrapyrgos nigripes]|uniref:DUF6534 domain-containing protein n=1 Tax=Tetrapyrgos nigripes TaxID=182062 RepID=A0A8H5CHI8_9AGAR|nr:hypothetical protein D9758_012198 [Tetrapyrgos nigripes]
MPPSIELLFGPMLIGCFLNAILYGVSAVQIFIYYQTYRNDSKFIRYFVLYLFIAETANTGFDIGMVYQPLILNYGTPAATTFFPLMLATDPIMTVCISCPVQFFIAWRIKVISGNKWIPVVICIFGLIGMAGGLWTGIDVSIFKLLERKPDLRWPALVWLMASFVADAIITTSLVTILSNETGSASTMYRKRTGIKSTDDVVNRVVRLTVQTGLITAIFAFLDVIFFLLPAFEKTTLNFVWDFSLSKIYTNALLSTLNARAGWDRIANNTITHNVLFLNESDGVQSSTTAVSSTGGYSKNRHGHDTQPMPGVYELETFSVNHDTDLEFNAKSLKKDVNQNDV